MESLAQSIKLKPAIVALLAAAMALSACDFDLEPTEVGTLNIRITDAPTDNPQIESLFVTIASVKVDGKIVDEFRGPKTLDILALQNGTSELLATGELLAQRYHTVTLQIDFSRDASRKAPGVYYVTKNGTQVDLFAGGTKSAGYSFVGSTRLYADDTSTIVLDFDLRKFIKEYTDGSVAAASNSELAGYLHFADQNEIGSIRGTYNGAIGENKRVIVYAYERGTFNAQTEKNGKGGIRFLNAVASAEVRNGSFYFPFVKEGEYEIHFVSYVTSANQVSYEGYLKAESETVEQPLNTIWVRPGLETSVNVLANGLLN